MDGKFVVSPRYDYGVKEGEELLMTVDIAQMRVKWQNPKGKIVEFPLSSHFEHQKLYAFVCTFNPEDSI